MKSKITLIILLVIIFFLGALSFFLGYKYYESNNKVSELNLQIENMSKEENEKSLEEEKTDNKVLDDGVIYKYNPSKIVNFDAEYISAYYEGVYRGSLTINGNKVTIVLPENGSLNGSNNREEFYFNEEIVSVVSSTIGQGQIEMIAFLSESGKVYISYGDKDLSDNIELTNLPKIYKLVCTTYSNEIGIFGTIVGIDADGNGYDLNMALSELNK